MKKVLIWDNFPLKNIGGPFGYCFNIHEYLKRNQNAQITFLSDLMPSGSVATYLKPAGRTGWKKILDHGVVKGLNDLVHQLFESHFIKVALPEGIDLNEFDYIHFHNTPDVAAARTYLEAFHGKTILTTHCPCPRTDEVLAMKPAWWKVFRHFMLSQEIAAFKSVDYLMFPCRGAREPYEDEPVIGRYFRSHEDKFFYCPSSILDLPVDEEKMQKYSELGIPEDAFVITYFGRHNHIKGYDILKNVGQELLDKYPNLYFLCAGRGDIAPLDHPRWKELGFIGNAHELLWQSDLYILPNRKTYFDLVVLEILRSRTNLLLAANGGNNYFKQYPEDMREGLGFFDVNDMQSLLGLVEDSIRQKSADPSAYLRKGESNRRLWELDFTIGKYVSRYVEQIDALI